MKINSTIFKAIKELIADLDDNQAELARQLLVSEATISKYVNGVTKKIDDDVWDRFYPLLHPYMDIPLNEQLHSINKPSDCEKICEKLTFLEKDQLRRYSALPESLRAVIFREIERIMQESALKKSNAGGVDCHSARAKAG